MRQILAADSANGTGFLQHLTADERYDIGDSAYNWNLNYTSSPNQYYSAGSIMKLRHSIHGIVECIYCYFPQGIREEDIGKPVFQLKGRTSYVVGFSEKIPAFSYGFSICVAPTNESCWSWVLIRGVNSISILLDTTISPQLHEELFIGVNQKLVREDQFTKRNLRSMFVMDSTKLEQTSDGVWAHPGSIYVA